MFSTRTRQQTAPDNPAPARAIIRCLIAAACVTGLGALGVAVVAVTGLPLPGAVLGMLMFLGLLALAPVTRRCADALFDRSVPHLPLLFVPAAAGVFEQAIHLESGLWLVLGAIFVATPVTIAVTALIAAAAFRIGETRRRARR